MSIINVMWSGGSPFASVHKVHQQILSQAAPDVSIKNWLLQHSAPACLCELGDTEALQLPSRFIKGRGIWALVRPLRNRFFRNALLKNDAQLVLLDGVGVARALLPAVRGLPHIRAVVMFHGSTRLQPQDLCFFRQFSTEQLTLCAVSKTLADAIAADVQLPVMTLSCMLDPHAFVPRLASREQARHQLAIPEHHQVFGAVGRLVESKGFDTLISAFAQTLKTHPDRLLIIIGEGAMRRALESQISALGVQDKVLLPGYVDNVASLYRAFDWMLIPSREEGLGLVVQEAVIAGIPVLASDLPVFHEQLGDAGSYVPVGDETAWAQAIEASACARATQVAAHQYASLDPEHAWLRFRQACSTVLSDR
ncbi:glycosyl transferase [Pseudomonas endophytica]|uniref:Glycosyl transferase n=1 Tax=Pseudomonas endophytica TaxID=1563157 RepID=A0A0Q0XNI8_9PSED|nr:glycosyltransferase [Pseudomonas endophytica]KQB51650.1 glycosyl transferase [Pseudomonas endophytica]